MGKRTLMENTNCPNCNHIIKENYCPRCGEMKFCRITMKDVVSDFFSNLVNVEGPVLNTIKDLTLRPGAMIRDYLNGQRKKYYKPFQYYILAATLFFLFFYLWGNDMMEMFSDLGAEYNNMATTEQMNQTQQKFTEFQNENMRLFTFLQVPIYALLIWLFFSKKSGYSFTESMVVSLYIEAQTLVISIISSLSVFIHPILPMIIPGVFMLLYFPWVFKQLYQEKTGVTIFKSLTIIVCGFILFGFLMSVISLVWYRMISN